MCPFLNDIFGVYFEYIKIQMHPIPLFSTGANLCCMPKQLNYIF